VTRQPPPPGLVAAAEQDYHTTLAQLTALTGRVGDLLNSGFTDFDAVADVWLTLRTRTDPPRALLMSAIAVVQLAKAQQTGKVEPT
jgi:hypothetical protein